MDEMACALAIDPVQLRLLNYAERNQNEDKPYSSKALRQCYAQGAQRFGWEQRNPEPRSMRQGPQLVGWGMAGGVWEAMQQKASAKASLDQQGKLTVSSATTDIGTGTYTVMTQIAAQASGVSLKDVTFVLGDSSLPKAPLQGGSFTVSSVGTAVQQACEALKEKLLAVARQTSADFSSVTAEQAVFEAGHLSFGDVQIDLAELVRSSGEERIEVQVDAEPDQRIPLQAHLCRVLAFDRDEGQGLAPYPLAVEVDVGAVTAGQDNVALAEYRWDPTRLTASATAVGNNISIGSARP